ncbi:MAG: HlyD family type I secretion periplasmic adaptor subunit [Desulfovibrio sp.]
MAGKNEKIRPSLDDSLHLSKALLLEEAGVPKLVRVVTFTLLVVIGAFIYWASITKIEEVAVAEGKIVPSGNMIRVQSEDGGTVRTIHVTEGQAVKKGDLLMQMDPTMMMTTHEQRLAQKGILLVKRERLKALIANRKPDFSAQKAKYPELASEQMNLYRQQLDSLAVEKAILNNQIKQYQAEIRELGNRESTLKKQFDLMDEEYKSFESLFDRKLVGKTEFFDIKRQFLQLQDQLLQLPITRIQVMEKFTESKNKLLRLKENARESWMQELGDVQENLTQIEQSLARSGHDVFQLDVKAPADALVHNLAVRYPGEVVKEGETMLELVPFDKNLIAEVRISSRDIGHIKAGQSVTVKLTAYDFSRYGGISGYVRKISPTTFMDEQDKVYYRGTILLDKPYVGQDAGNRLLPGMTLMADIRTGEKTILEYLLKPIYLSMKHSFRER